MGQFCTDFVDRHTLEFVEFHNVLFLAGEIGCKGRIVIGVTKRLEYVDGEANPLVQTTCYSYNVSVQGHGTLFRYDNQHPDSLYEGHTDEHHKHVFDWPSSDERADSPIWIGANNWPTLGAVIEEVRNWHGDHYDELEFPEDFPDDLQTGIRF